MARALLPHRAMHRVLLVYRGSVDVREVRRHCTAYLERLRGLEEPHDPHELAICRVLAQGSDNVVEGLRAQREITAALRAVLGTRAETVAVLIAAEGSPYDVEDCARDWGATLVVT
jgi:hypothetical protein